MSRHLTPRVFLLALAALLAGLPACARKSVEPPSDVMPARTMLRVVNRNFYDFTIYLVRFGDRVRLGLATGSSTSTFEFPSQFVQGGPIQFEADPVGASQPARTETLSVRPGDVVTVEIQP